MIRATGGCAWGATSTRSISRSTASALARSIVITPSCSLRSSITRTSFARIWSLIRSSLKAVDQASFDTKKDSPEAIFVPDLFGTGLEVEAWDSLAWQAGVYHALERSKPCVCLPQPWWSNLKAVRVLSLNLWARNGVWAARRAVLIDGLRELRPDLVAFQETIVTGEYDQVADLLGPDYEVVHQSQNLAASDPTFRGASIATRWRCRNVVEVDLDLTSRARSADFPCVSMLATLETPVGEILFVNHLPSWQLSFEAERELQAVAAAHRIEQLMAGRGQPGIGAGDFEAGPAPASIRCWT